MTIKRQPVSAKLVLGTSDKKPGSLYVTAHENGYTPITNELTPKEVDQLVLSALSMTKPEDLDPNAEEDYQAARAAVRVWQGTRAARESVRQRDAERDQVLRDAGIKASYHQLSVHDPIRPLVDTVIAERRKAAQK